MSLATTTDYTSPNLISFHQLQRNLPFIHALHHSQHARYEDDGVCGPGLPQQGKRLCSRRRRSPPNAGIMMSDRLSLVSSLSCLQTQRCCLSRSGLLRVDGVLRGNISRRHGAMSSMTCRWCLTSTPTRRGAPLRKIELRAHVVERQEGYQTR